MRLFATVITIGVLLIASLQLPSLWRGERDLGPLAPEALADAGVEKIAALSRSEIEALILKEKDVLRTSPLDATAHRNLAMLLLLPPTAEASSDLILNLARYSLSNPAVQMAAMGILLERKKYEEVAYRIDAVLRSNEQLSVSLFPLLAQHFTDKSGVQILTQRLEQKPGWRSAFLQFLSTQPAFDKLNLDIIRSLKSSKSPVEPDELRGMFYSWIKQYNSFDKSYFVWLDQLSTDELRLVKGVYDGEFSLTQNNLYFDWNISNTRNGKASIVQKPGSGLDRSLLVDFVGNTQAFKNVFQYLQLSPGQYDIAFDVMSKNLNAETGLVWRVFCAKENQPLSESEAIKSPLPWTKKLLAFEVPAENCETQILRLETKANRGLDTAVAGQIYFDSFEVRSRTTNTP